VLFVIGFVTLATLALVAAGLVLTRRPRGFRDPEVDRRMRHVRRHPLDVTADDIEQLLTASGLPEDDVRLVSRTAVVAGVQPYTLWLGLEVFGARALAIAVAANLSNAELLERLGSDALPDLPELEVFAGLNGLALARSSEPGPQRGRIPARLRTAPTSTRRARRSRVAA
jgi:hypothetical protein